jgi:hypothetical protein
MMVRTIEETLTYDLMRVVQELLHQCHHLKQLPSQDLVDRVEAALEALDGAWGCEIPGGPI